MMKNSSSWLLLCLACCVAYIIVTDYLVYTERNNPFMLGDTMLSSVRERSEEASGAVVSHTLVIQRSYGDADSCETMYRNRIEQYSGFGFFGIEKDSVMNLSISGLQTYIFDDAIVVPTFSGLLLEDHSPVINIKNPGILALFNTAQQSQDNYFVIADVTNVFANTGVIANDPQRVQRILNGTLPEPSCIYTLSTQQESLCDELYVSPYMFDDFIQYRIHCFHSARNEKKYMITADFYDPGVNTTSSGQKILQKNNTVRSYLLSKIMPKKG